MSYIADGEFPDDEITDITYMLESNDSFEELLHDLGREDDGEGTKVRIGDHKVRLGEVVKALEQAQNRGDDYGTAVKPWLDLVG